MRLETFFEKFELFADAPGAVAKMREMVLQLAVQGCLVAQSSEDELADALAVKIAKDREDFVKVRNLSRQREFARVADALCPFVLPHGWLWTRLGNLCRVQAGFAFASAAFIQGESGVPMIRIRDITKDHTQVNYVGEYREEFLVDAGDYLVGMDGNFTVAKWRGPRALLNQRVSRLQWYSKHLEPSFFAIALQYRLSELQGTKAYTTVDHLSSGQIENAVVPLPPLAEQKRIVAKVDELMALCDRLEAQQQERDTHHAALARASLARFAEAPTPANLDFLFHPSYPIAPADLRKTILTLAVQGKLVPQDPNDESAEELFAKLESERRRFADAHKFRSSAIVSVEKTTVPFDIPSTWKWCRLSSIFSAITDGDHLPPPKSDDGVAFLTIGNITTGKLEFEGSRFVPETYYRGLADFRRPKRGDILYTVVGATYGRPALVETDQPFCVQRHIAILKPPKSIDVGYLITVLRSPLAYEQATASTTGTAQPTIPLGSLRNFAAPLPPLAEQHRIVAKVNQLMDLVDQLETHLAEGKAKSAALLEAAIHELLNPTAEVVDLASYRAAIGCYAIRKMGDKRYFGRTAAMKVLYLAETHVGLALGLKPFREAAGPFDQWIYRFEKDGEREDWFKSVSLSTTDGKTKIEYRAGRTLAEKSSQAEQILTLDQRKEFDRLLALLSDKTTEDVEIIATLFAAWNDFLINGHTPSDDEIVTEVREHWHEKKARFAPAQLHKALGWLRQNNLVPTGRLPHTVHQQKLSLN